MKKSIKIALILAFFLADPLGLWANGTMEKAPNIAMDAQPRLYIAPGNPDAQVKTLQLPFSTITFTAQGQVIKSWTFSVYDSTGKLVSEDSRLETRDRGFFGELFNLGPKPQVEIPKELSWDGTYKLHDSPLDGKLVPDGNYTYQITLVDSAGGRAQTPPFNVTVKNSALAVDYIRIPQTIFSPAGQRKTIRVEQSSTREKQWSGQFTNLSGKVVRTITWENSSGENGKDVSAPTFEWDGKDQEGNILPDGDYAYTLVGRNRPGAVLLKKFDGSVTIDSKTGVIKLTSDSPYFSPNGDGILDTITFLPDIAEVSGLKAWKLQVTDPAHPEVVRWTQAGKGGLPDKVVFDGKNLAGDPLPEGKYQAVLMASFDNGDSAASNPAPFDLLLAPPAVEITADHLVFGGNGRAGVILSVKGDRGTVWALEVFDKTDRLVRHYDLGDTGFDSVEFQGLDEKGILFPDGPFLARASGRNKAGIIGSTEVLLRKDSRPMVAGLEVSRPVLVPGKGSQGVVRFTPDLAVVDSIDHTLMSVTDGAGKIVASQEADHIITYWDWDGKADSGAVVSDASYEANLEVTYANGMVAKAKTNLKVDSKFLDNEGPQAALTLSSPTFAPENIDGPQTLTIGMRGTQGASALDNWIVSVLDPRGKPFKHWEGKGAPPEKVIWDGKSDQGEYVDSGEDYQIQLTVTDVKARKARAQTVVATDILVTKLGDGKYKIVISAIQYSGYSSDVFKVPSDLLARNMDVLRKLAAVFRKFTEYKIRLDGYAVSEYWNDAKSAAAEQQKQLLPLSKDRAEEVENALVLLGVAPGRFTVHGFGAENPIVPNSDLENRWKNRRVEFYLEKN